MKKLIEITKTIKENEIYGVLKIHRCHHIYITKEYLVSFNPEKTPLVDIINGNYTVAISGTVYYNLPTKQKDGRVWCCESRLAHTL